MLLDLNDRFKLQVSVDPNLVNDCLITINRQFSSIEDALSTLAGFCGLEFVKVADVYVFRAKPLPPEESRPKSKPSFLFQGTIIESESKEPLPFSVIQFEGGGIVADENGRFSFKSEQSELTSTFRYLGYESKDTLIAYGNRLVVALEPNLTELTTIEVTSRKDIAPLANIGRSAGKIQFNDIANSLVPGLSDNLIFNNLRLYPGIMAAGESISDFVIWGSYAGQNHVVYDGITLFSSWGINDDIGRVNPYVIKNVEVLKGGYNAEYGDRVGGVVLIGTRAGNKNSVEANLNITNQLASAYLNVPVFSNRATLQVAGRKTILDGLDLAADFDEGDSLVVPRYDYTDFNLKFSTSFSNSDQLEISAIYSDDDYTGEVRDPRGQNGRVQDFNTNSTQRGASLNYVKSWENGGNTTFSMATSQYDPITSVSFQPRNQNPGNRDLVRASSANVISEDRIGIKHDFLSSANHQVKAGLEYVSSRAEFRTLIGDFGGLEIDDTSNRWSLFLNNRIQFTPDLIVELGAKADRPVNGSEFYFQPRVNAQYQISNNWSLHGAWGIYNQFVSKNFLIDNLGNRTESWMISDGVDNPIVEARHAVLGFGYNARLLQFGAEGFIKTTTGIQRFRINQQGTEFTEVGDADQKGLEFYMKKQIGAHEFMASYTLSEVSEQFQNSLRTFLEVAAPHSQNEELKVIASLSFKPVKISVSHVYGSGFTNQIQRIGQNQNPNNVADITIEPYHRTDLAIQFPFELGNASADAGVSILNLFNNRNVRLNQTISFDDGARINTIGIPFTPTFYLNLRF